MEPSRVVQPTIVQLPISGGDWIHVKRLLNFGERRALYKRSRRLDADGVAVFDPLEAGLATVLSYLVDWSLGFKDPTLVITQRPPAEVQAAYEALDEDSAVEILRAIEAHERAVTVERTAEKNGRGGEKTSGPISPSPSAVAGESSGSENSPSTTTTS